MEFSVPCCPTSRMNARCNEGTPTSPIGYSEAFHFIVVLNSPLIPLDSQAVQLAVLSDPRLAQLETNPGIKQVREE